MNQIAPAQLMEGVVFLSLCTHSGVDYLLSIPLWELCHIGKAVSTIGQRKDH